LQNKKLRKEPVIKEIVIELVILNGGEAGVKDPTTPDNFDDVEGMPSLHAVRWSRQLRRRCGVS